MNIDNKETLSALLLSVNQIISVDSKDIEAFYDDDKRPVLILVADYNNSLDRMKCLVKQLTEWLQILNKVEMNAFKRILIQIVYPQNYPIQMDELNCLNALLSKLSDNTKILWSIAERTDNKLSLVFVGQI